MALPLYAQDRFRQVAGPTLRPGGLSLTTRALALMPLPAGAMVVDVGCGPGASLALLAGRGLYAVGLDPQAPAQAVELPPGARRVCGTAEAMPLACGLAQAVLCECVLSVTREPLAALAQMHRVLQPGGYLALSDLYVRGTEAFAGGQPQEGCLAGAVGQEVLAERLRQSGFEVLLFEDHSRLLAQLAGQLLFSGFDASALGCGCAGSSGRVGYCFVLAKRKDA